MKSSLATALRTCAAAALLALAACSSSNDDPYVERPVDQLYNEAQDALEKEEYGDAAKLFDEVERQHPYSRWATKAQIMAAYSLYQNNKYDEAIVALDRF
ncbi:MAG: outer membrane protein assembly factor BamD, partial [Hyphomicrobiales bacterium]|nr:outer membrane protein assembly factor BamD [Hyphomicrobiales bacterium]